MIPRRLSSSLKFEVSHGYPKTIVIGIDEVGRGCLAGPVYAAAVAIPLERELLDEEWLGDITDSKALTEKKREALFAPIKSWALGYSIQLASVEEIDSINIFHASHLAMVRAAEDLIESNGLDDSNVQLLIDGKFLPKDLAWPATAIIKGDLKSLSIGAASILAKVARDRRMAEFDAEYPGYNFGKHKGYPTQVHIDALDEHGVSDIHRRTFRPVAERL